MRVISAAGAAGAVVGEDYFVVAWPYEPLPVDSSSTVIVSGEDGSVDRGHPDLAGLRSPEMAVRYPVYALYPVRGAERSLRG